MAQPLCAATNISGPNPLSRGSWTDNRANGSIQMDMEMKKAELKVSELPYTGSEAAELQAEQGSNQVGDV